MRKGECWAAKGPARIYANGQEADNRQQGAGSEACPNFLHISQLEASAVQCRGVIRMRTTREAKTIPNNYAIERSGRKTLESPARP